MAEAKPTLVLDINGTLVSTSDVRRSVLDRFAKESSEQLAYEGTLAVRYSAAYTQVLSIMKRPGLDKFLQDMAEVYDIIIFSHSEEPYVRTVHEFLDPGRRTVSQCLSRENCDGNFKDLRKLGRDLRRVVWLDDTPQSFAGFMDNGILVPTFSVQNCHSRGVDPRKDALLLELGPFLRAISSMDDLRPAIALWKTKKWKLVDGRVSVKNGWGWSDASAAASSGSQCTIL